MTSIRWCGTAARSAAMGLAVPTFMSRYTWAESTLTISTAKHRAISSASAVLPLAVGPISKIAGGNPAAAARLMRVDGESMRAPGSTRRTARAPRFVGLQVAVGGGEQARVGAGGARVPQHVADDVIGLDAPAGF